MGESAQSGFANDIMSNVQNPSMMFMMYSSVFGNTAFQVMPASKGQVQEGFNTVPYTSMEALLYNAAASNPIVAPTNIQSGGTSGVQNVSGTMTATDSTGNMRVAIGNTSNVSNTST